MTKKTPQENEESFYTRLFDGIRGVVRAAEDTDGMDADKKKAYLKNVSATIEMLKEGE